MGTYRDGIFADNAASLFFAFNSRVIDSLVVGISSSLTESDLDFLAGGSFGLSDDLIGVLLYDGPFSLESVHFARFSESLLSHDGIEYAPSAFKLMGGLARYVNLTRGLSFDPAEPYFKIDMGRAQARTEYWADSYTASIRDLDGSLSGVPDAEIRPNHELNWELGCTEYPEWSAYLCSYQSAHLRFRNRSKVDNAINTSDITFTLQKNSGPTYARSDISENLFYNKFSMTPDSSNIYHVSDYILDSVGAGAAEWVDLFFTSERAGELSSVVSFEFPVGSASCEIVEGYASDSNDRTLNVMSSLGALLGSTDHGQIRVGEKIYFKLKAYGEFRSISKMGIYGIACE